MKPPSKVRERAQSPRVIAWRLNGRQRGMAREAMLTHAIRLAADGDRASAAIIDRMVEAFDAAWDAAEGQRRLYAAGEGRKAPRPAPEGKGAAAHGD